MKEQIKDPEYDSYYANPEQLEFKEFISEKLKAVNSVSGYSHITAWELAETLGMSKKVFLEILNGRRGDSDRRDFVIALCAELGLDAVETNEALRLFPGFLRRLSGDDPRDRLITDFLNAGFDVDISYASLNRHLSAHNYPPLKIKYRNPAQNEKRRDMMEEKKIDWNLKTGEERQRYNYYISLGYDHKTASVLALFTYGDESIPTFSIQDAYEAFASGRPYPVKEPDPDILAFFDEEADLTELRFQKGIAPSVSPCEFEELSDDTEYSESPDNSMFDKARDYMSNSCDYVSPPLVVHGRKARVSVKSQRILSSPKNLDTDEYNGIEEKDARDTALQSHSTFRMDPSQPVAEQAVNF